MANRRSQAQCRHGAAIQHLATYDTTSGAFVGLGRNNLQVFTHTIEMPDERSSSALETDTNISKSGVVDARSSDTTNNILFQPQPPPIQRGLILLAQKAQPQHQRP